MRFVAVSLLIAICLVPIASGAAACSRPELRGSFLQPALGDRWTWKEWSKEFEYMQAAGLDQMLIQWTADSKEKTTIFPSSLPGYRQNTRHDVVERALATADASDAKVYLGLQINDDWWSKYIDDGAWLENEATIGNALADDLWARYQGHPSLAGWYLPFEVDNVETGPEQWDNLIAFYRTVGDHLRLLAPGKPVVISPFFDTHQGMTSSQWQAMWEYVLQGSSIDVLALQDGVGAGHATARQLPEWFDAVGEAIQDVHAATELWADTETFHRGYATMPIRSIVDDMCAVQPYVSNDVSFSFNHYLSPQQVDHHYYRTYMDYLTTGTVERVPPSAPAKLTAAAVDSSTIQLTWRASKDNIGVVGYTVTRNSRHLATLHGRETAYVDAGLDAGMTYTYQIRAFDAAGNSSNWSGAASASTPPPHLYPTNIALGKPYVASMDADAAYPDTGGVELTDGMIGSSSYADSAWQGRATTKPYTFTLDLGSSQVIREVRMHWLQDEKSGILLPHEISCATSDDGVNFSSIGTVKKPLPVEGLREWWYTLTDLTNTKGRYVQLRVLPGSNAEWTFLDELEVRQ